MKTSLTTLATWLTLFVPVIAAPSIVAGEHDLQPNLAGQTIFVFVSGGDPVQGINFNVQVGDGGVAAGGTDTGPVIQNVNLLSGIFAGNNTGQTDGSSPLLWNSTTTTNSGTVSANGLLAALTISTVGFESGTYDLSLTPGDDFGGATDFAGIAAQITNGSIRVIPEPATWQLSLLAAAALVIAGRIRPSQR